VGGVEGERLSLVRRALGESVVLRELAADQVIYGRVARPRLEGGAAVVRLGREIALEVAMTAS